MENSVEQEKRKVPVIEVYEAQLLAHVSEVIRQSVEDAGRSLSGGRGRLLQSAPL